MVSYKAMGWERRRCITIYNSTRLFFESVLFLEYEGRKGSGVQWRARGTSGIHQAAKLEDAFLFFLLFFYPFLQNYVKDNFDVWETIGERAVGIF